jgi:hypothetical protein
MMNLALWSCQSVQCMCAFLIYLFAHYDNIFFMYKICKRLKLPIVNTHVI